MTRSLHGKVHGRISELDHDPGLADGEQRDGILVESRQARSVVTT